MSVIPPDKRLSTEIMQVLKFGGTSVGSPENITKVRDIINSKADENSMIVVVSAFGGITNQLLQCSQMAAIANKSYLEVLEAIKKRHFNCIKELLPFKSQDKVLKHVQVHLKELEDILHGIFLIGELSPKTLDRISCMGETLSSMIIHNYLFESGIDTILTDPRDIIFTDSYFGKANVDFPKTEKAIRKYFKEKTGKVYVCPGFIANDNKGNTTTLGRGGSDYTAAIIAAALNTASLEIWTDVSGMMTANPKLVRQAYPIEQIDYEEAMELTHFGAKVLYPPSVHPVYKKRIPIYIKNTFEPEAKGTMIHHFQDDKSKVIKGLSCIENIALLNLSGSSMVGIPYFSHRLFEALAQSKISVILITQASSEHSICVAIDQADVEKAKSAINQSFRKEFEDEMLDELYVEEELAILALVGSQMKNHIGISGKMFNILGHNGINIKAIAQGSSEKNISAVIEKRQIKKALNSLHESFFLSDLKRVNLFIVGAGNVGKALLDQLQQQKGFLKEKTRIDLRIIGMANSRKMIINEEGYSLELAFEELEKSQTKMDLEQFLNQMYELNMRNSIFIDNTANEDVAATYADVLEKSISVVTPNKIACTGQFEDYKKLKQLALRYNCQFLFETNVGAGLPVINTLSDLIKSGDEIHGIQAVLSGSLNFIFNNYDAKSVSFADIVKQAKVEGYTEPDPRIDLSGVDVKRKILILLRESGFEMELKDIDTVPFIPDECMKAKDVDQFLDSLLKYESHFQKMIEEAKQEGKKLKYVATFQNGKANTGLEKIAPESPLYNLEGKDNIVLFSTKRYPEQPLVIKGAGAGAAVTASGIFGDIMRIANTF